MSAGNAKPRPAPAAGQLVVRVEPYNNFREILRLLPASIASAVFHGALFLLIWFISGTRSDTGETVKDADDDTDRAAFSRDRVKPKVDFTKDTAMEGPVLETFAIESRSVAERERKDVVDMPGPILPKEPIGVPTGDLKSLPISMPSPAGFGIGPGATVVKSLTGKFNFSGMPGGGGKGVPYPGSFYGRGGAYKEAGLKMGGGTTETEAAVTRGLKWIVKNQYNDGSWRLDSSKFKEVGLKNDVGGTAFGLLPLLGAGKTHKMVTDDPQILKNKDALELEKAYSKAVEKGILFLIRQQDKKSGKLDDNMYAHGIAAIAMCEAYGLSQDANLRPYAQKAVDYIVYCQHDMGGWRYGPKQAGDTSAVGWQVMALKSAQMSGLNVPEITMKKAIRFLEDVVCDKGKSEGYGYTGPSPTHTLTAVGLLCRQYLQSWGPKNPRMQTAIEIIKRSPPTAGDMYYTYYATQVMHHYGGQEWDEWNRKMRDSLLAAQDKTASPMHGSFGGVGGHVQGRLMQTSLCILSLEVYYRYLPLYYRATEEMVSKE